MRPSPLLTAVGASVGTFAALGGATLLVSGVTLSVAKAVVRRRKVRGVIGPQLPVLCWCPCMHACSMHARLGCPEHSVQPSLPPRPHRLPMQLSTATPCGQCGGRGYVACQVCMGASGQSGARAGMKGCMGSQQEARCPALLIRPSCTCVPACRHPDPALPTASAAEAAAAAAESSSDSRQWRGRRSRRQRHAAAGSLRLPRLRRNKRAAVPQLHGPGPRVPAQLTTAACDNEAGAACTTTPDCTSNCHY